MKNIIMAWAGTTIVSLGFSCYYVNLLHTLAVLLLSFVLLVIIGLLNLLPESFWQLLITLGFLYIGFLAL